MGTLREYYETDFGSHYDAVDRELTVETSEGALKLCSRAHFDIYANCMFVSCFVPTGKNTLLACLALVNGVKVVLNVKDAFTKQSAQSGRDCDDRLTTATTQFTGRLFVYTEDQVSEDQRRQLAAHALEQGIHLVFRGPGYADHRTQSKRPAAFISHDSRDKDEIARKIAIGLMQRYCTVWYDEYSLRVGMRLRESIERGLKECKKCILVVSPHFLSNVGWTRGEFDSIFTREIIENSELFLPVWHGVTQKDVYEYSPNLAGRFALNWEIGEYTVITQLHRAIVSAG